MNIRPLRDRIIVQRLEEGEQHIGGIIIPEYLIMKEDDVLAVLKGKTKNTPVGVKGKTGKTLVGLRGKTKKKTKTKKR